MHGRIVHGHPFGRGGGVMFSVRRDKRYRPQLGILMTPMKVEADGQLHGVVGPEPVLAGTPASVTEQGRG